MKTNTCPLNALRITWSIIEIEGSFTKSILKRLSKLGYMAIGKSVACYHSSKSEKINAAIEILTAANKCGRITTITDKQYGMTQNSWNGFAKQVAAPFKHAIVAKDGNYVCVIPVTENQIKKAIKF